MLKHLFGCKSVEKILLFLLVNEKCYAHQLQRMLHISLTPIQKALARLEEGQIITCHYEGKAKIYQFNPSYPLLNELEILLQRAFHRLPPNEKKGYYYLKPEKYSDSKKDYELIELIWCQLASITRVTLIAKSRSKCTMEWNRKGKGAVHIKQEPNSLIFQESGTWHGEGERPHNYCSSFRWTLNRLDKLISLEHLRLGEHNPIFLFHLVPSEDNRLESLTPHLCGEDSYFGWLKYTPLFIQMNFKTIGPKKNEEIEYIYT
jgi:uncharacterized protein DUF6314